MTLVRLEPAALRSRVKHSTTEPLRSQACADPVTLTKEPYPTLAWIHRLCYSQSDDVEKELLVSKLQCPQVLVYQPPEMNIYTGLDKYTLLL